jgi:hypothetical protein
MAGFKSDKLLSKLVFDVHKSASNGETIDKVMVLSLKTTQAIQTHVDKKVNEVLDRVDEEVIGEDVITDPNPEIPVGVNESYDIKCYNRVGANDLREQQRQAIKQLRSEL